MKKLLIALMTIGLLATAPQVLADRGQDGRGFQKMHDRDDGFLKKRVHRDQRGYRDRGHHRHGYRHPGRHKGNKWHRGGHDRRYDGGHRRHRDGYHKHRRHSRDHDRRRSFFGIGDGQRGVLIWRD